VNAPISRDAAMAHTSSETGRAVVVVLTALSRYFHLISFISPSLHFSTRQHQNYCPICQSAPASNDQHACLHRHRHLPPPGPLRRSTFRRQIIQVLQHHTQHILHLPRRCHPHRQRLRPNPLQLQHVLRRHPHRRRLRRSIRQRSNTNALAKPACL
jgi:hypothetical protein